MPKLGPYSRAATLAKLDGRSKEARLVRVVREELTAHVGGKPSATQRALIERAAALQLQVALLDATAAKRSGVMTEHDSRTYLAWSNTLARTLKLLGTGNAAPNDPSPTLADVIRNHAAAKSAQV